MTDQSEPEFARLLRRAMESAYREWFLNKPWLAGDYAAFRTGFENGVSWAQEQARQDAAGGAGDGDDH